MEDKQIVALYWERSETAIYETEKKYGRYCRYIAYNILYSDQDAEECVNDTYQKAWETMPPKQPELLSTYLGKITRSLAINRFRYHNGTIYTLYDLAEIDQSSNLDQFPKDKLEQLYYNIHTFCEEHQTELPPETVDVFNKITAISVDSITD